MANIDLKREYRDHYTCPRHPVLVDVPARRFLMVDGSGDPNTSEEYRAAVGALFPIAYGLRKVVRQTTGDVYTVMPLEGLWWVNDMSDFSLDDKSGWRWTMMLLQPGVVTEKMVDVVAPEVTERKGLVSGHLVRLEVYAEGRAAQVLHVGPYAEEAPTIGRLHDFIAVGGYRLVGKHHEIYLSNPDRVASERMKTIIRQPIEA